MFGYSGFRHYRKLMGERLIGEVLRQTSPTVESLKGKLPQKLQSKSAFFAKLFYTQSVSSWVHK